MGVPYAEVIGDPIAHSKSPLIHKFWLEQLGHRRRLSGDACYSRRSCRPISAARRVDPDWRGCNVTMPHKQTVVPLLDEIADDDIGAVNCIVPRIRAAGRTQYRRAGISAALQSAPADKRQPANHVATCFHVIGAGGAARAVAASIRGADVDFFNRDETRAKDLAREFSRFDGGHSLEVLGGGADYEYDPAYPDVKPNKGIDQRYSFIIVNASSMGMTGKPPVPIDLDSYPDNTLVFDLVYDPAGDAPDCRGAGSVACRQSTGSPCSSARRASPFEYFFGRRPPPGDDALRQRLTS